MITIKADEKLFNRWKELGYKVMSLDSIVQNNMEIDIADLVEWSKLVSTYAIELGDLHRMTLVHISNDNDNLYQQLQEKGR